MFLANTSIQYVTAKYRGDRQHPRTVTEGASPDHPWKRIYERRMNTIIQKLRRGTLDEKTASMMKQLAKDKMEREALLAEAQKYSKRQ